MKIETPLNQRNHNIDSQRYPLLPCFNENLNVGETKSNNDIKIQIDLNSKSNEDIHIVPSSVYSVKSPTIRLKYL